MIAFVDGRLVQKDPTFVIIETHGIGYQIRISLQTYSSLQEGERCKLITFLHIKEDAHTLYGFSTEKEKKVFMDLISISGVGPNTALTCLSSMNASEIVQAIVNEDVKTVQSIKGIGAKTAQRIILELKDKMKKELPAGEASHISGISHNTLRNEALSALMTLGIAKGAAEKSIDSILKKEGNISLEQLIKYALKSA
ncbi:Holliday junction branch migration protein RuvA [Cytophagaceae bacterium ABcell3]|nr:Holliday junction branch migration protein RuvA [Cytophagaceae bacterium ABcell3]